MSVFAARMSRLRSAMASATVDAVLLSVGADLPYFTGYEAMPLERLTMLVVPCDGDPTLVVPRLEAPRVHDRPDVFRLVVWDETDDPVALVSDHLAGAGSVAVGDRTWARFLVELMDGLPDVRWRRAGDITGPLRAVKAPGEIEALQQAAAAADRVAAQLQAGDVPLVGRTEAEVAADLGRRLLEAGHQRVNFAIVAAGANAASPHHEPSERRIRVGEGVLCDIGATMHDADGVGYCSDITRCVWLGEPPAEFAELYAVLLDAQQAAVAASVVGTPCSAVDGVARARIDDAGLGQWFVHRTGHGIGVEAHEDPYLVAGNDTPLEAGHAFSIEPGIYRPGRWGARLEDIVVATDDGPLPLNRVDHGLAVIDA